jgi:hypothetical protein
MGPRFPSLALIPHPLDHIPRLQPNAQAHLAEHLARKHFHVAAGYGVFCVWNSAQISRSIIGTNPNVNYNRLNVPDRAVGIWS